MNLLRSELRKITSTRTWLWLTLGSVALTALSVYAYWFIIKSSNATISGPIDVQSVKDLYGFTGASKGYLFALIIGIVAMTSEFRFGTIVPTLLTTPQRQVVVFTKLTAAAIVAGFVGLVSVVAGFLTATLLLLTKSHDSISAGDLAAIAAGTLLAYVLAALIGVGLGAFMRNQILAVVLSVLWVLVVEGIITLILTAKHLTSIAKYLPNSAVNALVSVHNPNLANTGLSLQPWAAAVVLGLYAALFVLLAFTTTLRRDVA